MLSGEGFEHAWLRKMAGKSVSEFNKAPPSPEHKRCRLEESDEEVDLPDEIFPSEESCSGSYDVLYPSEESDSEPAAVERFSLSPQLDIRSCENNGDSNEAELKKIGQLLIGTCCSHLCLRHLTATDIIAAKASCSSLTASEQRLYLFNKLQEGSCECNPKGIIKTKFFIAGKEVCGTAWTQIYEISARTLSRMLKQLNEKEDATHGNLGKRRVNTKAESASAWMDHYFNLIGDKMPDKDQVHLPSWETQKDIHSRYVQDMKERGISDEEIAGLSFFYKIWTDQFPSVVIPQENRFAKCDICVKVKLERKNCLDKAKQEEMKKLLDCHLERVRNERRKYHSHREKSRLYPEKFLTLIVDGMDQSKTNLPNTKHIAKSTSSLWRLRTHVTGVIMHTKASYAKLVYCFVDLIQYPHDSNLTLTVILNVLVDFVKINSYLPEVLYLQMDNTCRENKNRFVLTFSAVLVHLQIFKKVQINFLPVGHTHEDIDQMFSKVSDTIRKSGCESIPDLLVKLNQSYKPNPTSKLIKGVWDFKAWLKPTQSEMDYHSKYHVFKFTKGSKVEMHYKQYSSDAWLPEGVGEHLILDEPEVPDVTDIPPLVEPNSDKLDLPRFYQDLPKYYHYLSSLSCEHWKQFQLDHKEAICNNEISWEMPRLVSAAILSSTIPRPYNEISRETLQLLEKETAVPKPIKVKHKGKENTSNAANKTNPVTEFDKPTAGTIVACYLPKYSDEEPQLGKVVDNQGDRLIVEWLVGSYSDPWIIWKKKIGADYVTWEEGIPKEAVLFPVTLSKAHRLSNSSILKLKAIYEQKRKM